MRFPGRGVRAGGMLGGLGARGAVCGVVCAGRLGSERGWSNRGAGCSSHSPTNHFDGSVGSPFPLPGPSGFGEVFGWADKTSKLAVGRVGAGGPLLGPPLYAFRGVLVWGIFRLSKSLGAWAGGLFFKFWAHGRTS
jgi:hypothetical protein